MPNAFCFGVVLFAVLKVKMCISKSEVRNRGMPLALGRIINLRDCKQIILQEKNDVEVKVKQNR